MPCFKDSSQPTFDIHCNHSGQALGPEAHYMEVFRFTGAAAFGGYALALLQNSIWYHRAWNSTLKSMADGFIPALLTAGIFGWLWPI